MKTSPQGLDLLIEREGLRTKAYRDSEGIVTIGVGHVSPDVKMGDEWTVEKCKAVFAEDIKWAEDAVNAIIGSDLEQYQFDALVSFVFNIGAGAFKLSTMRKMLGAGLIDEAGKQFDRWHSPPEIISRRNAEREQFRGLAFEARIA